MTDRNKSLQVLKASTVFENPRITVAYSAGLCPFCHDALGSAQHVFWDCRVTNVEQLRPQDASEAVFGWPVSKDNDKCLKHMAAVRCQVLALRYPGGGKKHILY